MTWCQRQSLPKPPRIQIDLEAVELLRTVVLVGVVLIGTLAANVVVIVHVVSRLDGVVFGTDFVVLVHS